MPNQREIATLLGVTQATVSRALRGDHTISSDMRRRVRNAAEQLGYHPDAYVNILMSHIRSGKKLEDKGVIAMLVNADSQESWYEIVSYRAFHRGVVRRGIELGFDVECHFLRTPNMSVTKIERILHTRGIQGMILAPPYQGNRALDLHWDRYAAIAVGFGAERQDLDRLVYDQYQNYLTAFHELQRLGYRRIGTVLSKSLVDGNHYKTRWFAGYLECQNGVADECRIPIFAGAYGQSELETFRNWYDQWLPDVLLTMVGWESEWLRAMGLRVPEDIGVACLSQPTKPTYACVDEEGEVVGATALELVAGKIARNEYGIPSHSKVTMIEGRWVDGSTVQKQ